jgi:hypothetical protein
MQARCVDRSGATKTGSARESGEPSNPHKAIVLPNPPQASSKSSYRNRSGDQGPSRPLALPPEQFRPSLQTSERQLARPTNSGNLRVKTDFSATITRCTLRRSVAKLETLGLRITNSATGLQICN